MVKISNAELKVMEVIWKNKETTLTEIIKELSNIKWNHNTIRTLINRLVGKKAIGIVKKTGKTYTYVSLVERKKYVKFITKAFINNIFNGSIEDFIVAVVEDDVNALMELRQLLKDIK